MAWTARKMVQGRRIWVGPSMSLTGEILADNHGQAVGIGSGLQCTSGRGRDRSINV